jgi:hypothetical protein
MRHHDRPRLSTAYVLLVLGAAGCSTSSTPAAPASAGGAGGAGAAGVVGGTGGGSAPSGPSAVFVGIYNDILSTKCAPCHVTLMPRLGMLDLGDVNSAFSNLTAGTTVCAGAVEKRRVVPGNPGESYLIKKLLGTQPMGCGQRMPRTPMRTVPPFCVDPPATSADTSPPDAGATDAAPQPAPRACLPASDIARLDAWIQAGAR